MNATTDTVTPTVSKVFYNLPTVTKGTDGHGRRLVADRGTALSASAASLGNKHADIIKIDFIPDLEI